MHSRHLAATAAAIALGAPAAHAAGFTSVQATCLSNCFDPSQSYEQVIDASTFSGPVNIGSFSFNRSLLGDGHQTSVFHVTFWTADGRQVGDFGHYMVGSLGRQVLHLQGQAFAYDASQGNLVMKIQRDGGGWGAITGAAGSSGGAADPAASDDNVQSVWNAPKVTFMPKGVTFPAEPLLIVAAPEPAAWAMMLIGFGGAGALLRRRRTRPA